MNSSFDVVPLKKANAEFIYATLTDWFKEKGVQLSKLVAKPYTRELDRSYVCLSIYMYVIDALDSPRNDPHFSSYSDLKIVQQVLNLPELKVIKSSDTCWLAHERCVKAVKESYSAIVIAPGSFYEQTPEPEALGINKVLSRKSTVIAIFLLDFVLPQVAKLSKHLQTEKLNCYLWPG